MDGCPPQGFNLGPTEEPQRVVATFLHVIDANGMTIKSKNSRDVVRFWIICGLQNVNGAILSPVEDANDCILEILLLSAFDGFYDTRIILKLYKRPVIAEDVP